MFLRNTRIWTPTNIVPSQKKKRLEWIVPEASRIGHAFNSEAVKIFPVFKEEAKVCIHFHCKGYCFNNCGLKASHVGLLAKVAHQYHAWQLKYRTDWRPRWSWDGTPPPPPTPNIYCFPDLPSADRAQRAPEIVQRDVRPFESFPVVKSLSTVA